METDRKGTLSPGPLLQKSKLFQVIRLTVDLQSYKAHRLKESFPDGRGDSRIPHYQTTSLPRNSSTVKLSSHNDF